VWKKVNTVTACKEGRFDASALRGSGRGGRGTGKRENKKGIGLPCRRYLQSALAEGGDRSEARRKDLYIGEAVRRVLLEKRATTQDGHGNREVGRKGDSRIKNNPGCGCLGLALGRFRHACPGQQTRIWGGGEGKLRKMGEEEGGGGTQS